MTAFRLCERRHADAGRAFRGEGARMAGGRWNPPGIAVVYTSGSLSLASLELLAHFDSSTDMPDLVFFRVQFDERLVARVDQLPPNWRQIPAPSNTQLLGAAWWQSGRLAVLRVPSVIIPSEDNFVLNPSHPDFKAMAIEPPEPFSIDPRLLGAAGEGGENSAMKSKADPQ
ncbi:MAG: RES family NAD+ phosphorylase [Chloroflexi bacterium]|nr:RES family NAD+ phosphorylase [Chloroflexota bacterium]